ncbi:Aminoglycoside N3'-acetyltransferase [Halanaeroarchaeum sp. HSR-CO]|uniref:aminoglycoside N(3)-acetyltransferase n=1 Tax=Halanaeroarchaeum sp. HSR-CO TaxID=2866382 RepID=UPI00217CE295|nr:AAC(3) family N-acetyltransferase [Halanaeroarchaeum sp. HSR-CO]UWG47738.1 Aminoglycoside N3'-acetyltransferase [Halanaeroarchaeum sp. HSR-CO]
MGERDTIARVAEPVTVDSMVSDFRSLGIETGDTLIVHSSLSALGWVSGGAQAVVDALQCTLSESGTLVMPTHTSQYTDPARWSNPPVPESWYETIRDSMPAFRPGMTPTRDVGAIPECFRTYPAVQRSTHPEVSFAAWGAEAEGIVSGHAIDFGLGERSPLAGIYDNAGKILLLGTNHNTNTSLHLAEYRADISVPRVSNAAPIRRDGERVVVEYVDIELSTDDFLDIGAAFEREHDAESGQVGAANATVIDQRSLVDFAVEWMESNR